MKIYLPKFKNYGGVFERMPLIKTKWFSVSIHKISGPDPEWLAPHDHGCDFFSLILSGGYTERIYVHPELGLNRTKDRTHKPWSGHILRNQYAHRVIAAKPTKTVFITWNHLNRRPMAYTPMGHLAYKDYYGKGLHLVNK